MDSDADAINRAILEDPYDDAPRLALADWLDEHDAPRRAELIRLGCTLARMPCKHYRHAKASCDACREMKERHAYLVHHALRDWQVLIGQKRARVPSYLPEVSWMTDDLPVMVEGSPEWAKGVRRGFLQSVRLRGVDLDRIAADLFSGLPILMVRLTDVTFFQPSPFSNDYQIAMTANRLPAQIYEIIMAGQVTFGSRRAAEKAISQRCVAWGRKLVGLKPLKQGRGSRSPKRSPASPALP